MNRNLRDYQPSGTHQAPRGRQSIEELSLSLSFYCCFAYDGLGIFTCYKVVKPLMGNTMKSILKQKH